MEKLKFIGVVIFGVAVAYLLITVLMPIIVDVTTDTAANITASPNTYPGAVEATQYAPLALYFAPALVGIGAIVYKLKFSK